MPDDERTDDEEMILAIEFLKRTHAGEYSTVDMESCKGKRIDVPDINVEEELYYYSISN